MATARARKQSKKGKKTLGKARVLSKDDADRLRADTETEKAAEIAHKIAMGQKKKEQALKKAQEEADKAERARQRVINRDIKAEMAQMAKIHRLLFT